MKQIDIHRQMDIVTNTNTDVYRRIETGPDGYKHKSRKRYIDRLRVDIGTNTTTERFYKFTILFV